MERIDVIDVNKGSIAVEKTLSELKTEHEKGLQKERSKGLENYFRMSRKFEEEFNQLSIRDAQDLNSERERLEKKIAELKLKNAKSNFQSELLLLNQLKVITRNYNIDNAKQELSLVNSSIRELKKHRSDYEEYIRKKHSATLNDISYREQESNKKIEALKTQLSNARGKKNRAEIKSNLDSELKNLKAIQQERQDAIADYQEKKSKGLKTELKEEQELRLKTAKDIYTKSRESGKSISESYKAVLDVDPNNR